MNVQALTLSLGLFLLVSSCCPDFECEPFQDKGNWMQAPAGNQLSFVDSLGTEVLFDKPKVTATPAYKVDNKFVGIGCLETECDIKGSISMQTPDKEFVPEGVYQITIESRASEEQLYYVLGDFRGSFQLKPFLTMPQTEKTTARERDSILSTLHLGNKDYTNVVVQSKNMSNAPASTSVEKVFLAEGHGIIGFVSKGRLFFRK